MDGEDALAKIGVGSTIIIIGFGIGTFFHYLLRVVLARFFGPEIYGVFVQGLAVTQAVAVLALLGLHVSTPRFMSYYQGKDQEDMKSKVVSTSLYMVIPLAVAVSAVLFFSAEWLSLTVFSEPALVTPLKLFSFAVLPLVLVQFTKSMLRGLQDAKHKIYLDDIIWSGSILLIALAFIWAGHGIEGAVYAYLLATSATVLVGYYFYKKVSGDKVFTVSGLLPRKLLLFSWPLFVISLLTITNRWVDILMLGWLAESAQAGIYDLSYAVAGMMAFLLTAFSYMFMPVVSELYGKEDITRIKEIYSTSTRWVVTAVLPLLAGMIIFSREVMSLLFGEDYIAGAVPLAVLSVGFAYKAFKGPAGRILLSAGKTKLQMLGIASITAVTVVLNLLLIPVYGMTGAAISTTAGFLVGDTVLLLLAKREIGGLPYSRKYLPAAVSIILASGIVYVLKLSLSPGLLLSAVLGAFLVLVYALLLHIFGGIQDKDWEMFWHVVGVIR